MVSIFVLTTDEATAAILFFNSEEFLSNEIAEERLLVFRLKILSEGRIHQLPILLLKGYPDLVLF